ncbi:hypothetical protein XH98_36045 [Bradyrhizobium sp. CCBAU 51745]|nr:hypothetical protein [Bradyrhizobium sp. CCBAU 51745]
MAGPKLVWTGEAAKHRADLRQQREGCRRLFAVEHAPQIRNCEGLVLGYTRRSFEAISWVRIEDAGIALGCPHIERIGVFVR